MFLRAIVFRVWAELAPDPGLQKRRRMYAITTTSPVRAVMIFATSTVTFAGICAFMVFIPLGCSRSSAARPPNIRGRAVEVTKSPPSGGILSLLTTWMPPRQGLPTVALRRRKVPKLCGSVVFTAGNSVAGVVSATSATGHDLKPNVCVKRYGAFCRVRLNALLSLLGVLQGAL